MNKNYRVLIITLSLIFGENSFAGLLVIDSQAIMQNTISWTQQFAGVVDPYVKTVYCLI